MEQFPDLDFHHFHLLTLPALLADGHGQLAAVAARELAPLCFRLSGTDNAYTYQPGPETINIVAGTEADTVIDIDQQSWQGLVYDLESAPGLLYSGKLGHGEGDAMLFVLWEPALRAMFHGRPLYDVNARLSDERGNELSPAQSFNLTDSAQAMREFLAAAGYLLLKNVFSPAEILQYRAAAEQLKQQAVEGDKLSWWGKDADGKSVLCRVIHGSVMPAFAGLYQDPRLQKMASTLLDGLVAMDPNEVDGVTVIYKNPNMASGLSDLPWHRDCGLGGHALMCPKIICSIYLYDADESSGPLKFLPGSHKASYGFMDANDPNSPSGVTVQAKAGDITLHYSDVMHAAPAPLSGDGPHRVSILLNYDREFKHHEGSRHYNDVLLSSDDGQVTHLEKLIDTD